jgi:hypothetical protein
MKYLSFLFLKLRHLKFFGLLGIALAIGLFSASNANAQRVTFGVGIGAPAYYGPAPVCAYGYYDYYPYACAPYGFYGPDWFAGGVFIGAGPWYHGYYGRGYYGRGYGGYGRGGGYYGRGGYGRGFDRGYRGGDFHGGNGYRGGGNFHGGGEFHGGNSFHGGGESHGGGSFHGGGGSHGGGHGGGGRH